MIRMTAATVFAAAVSCAAAPSVLAAREGSQFGYAISAVGFNSYFIFNSHPGGSVHGTLRVVSLTPEVKTILLNPADVSTAAAGGLQYGNPPAHSEGSWLKLAVRSVRLSGNGSVTVPFTAAVPEDAPSGDHFLGITAVDRRAMTGAVTGNGPIRLRLIPRLAMTVQIRLPGPRVTAMSVGRAWIAVAPSGASLALGISNPGNRLIGPATGRITVSRGATPLFSQEVDLGPFVPRTAVAYHIPWEGTPAQGTYRVKGEIIPSHARPVAIDRTVTFGTSAIRQFRQQTGRPATEAPSAPLALEILLGLAIAAAAGFGFAYARVRNQASNTPPSN